MKYIDERKPTAIDFEKINVAQVFFAEDFDYGANPYMRIFKIVDEDGDWYNAVDLFDGTMTYFNDNEQVIKCEACLTIR